MIEYPKNVKSLTEMLTAANREVSRLSNTVSFQQSALRQTEIDRDAWIRRFDKLLEIRK